jgi:hypothetical protein
MNDVSLARRAVLVWISLMVEVILFSKRYLVHQQQQADAHLKSVFLLTSSWGKARIHDRDNNDKC